VSMTKAKKSDGRESEARRLRRELFTDEMLDQLMAATDERGLSLTGEGGFLPEMIKAVLERGMEAELTGHLGYEKGDPAGNGSGNSRNGTTPKTVGTEVGDIALDQPRDRNSTFASSLVPKGARRLGGLEDMIISLYAGGMTIRDIQHHLAATLGTDLSHETISKVTDAVAEEVTAWQTRPLEAFYPVIYLDALVVKIRDGAHVSNRAAHIAVGVDMDGVKHVLGIWVQATEGAKFWASVCAELANRGVKDVLIVCCDGLTGFPEAIEATWARAMVQTCVVHLIRASMRFVSYSDRKAVAALLKPIYTAANEDAALIALATFADSNLGKKYPAALASWENAWEPVHPVPGVRARAAQGHLHDQLDRVVELPTAQDHQEPRPLPGRRRRDQAALAGHPQHRGQESPRTRQRGRTTQGPPPQGPQQTRRRLRHPRLESRPRRTRPHLPRPPARCLAVFPRSDATPYSVTT
jgi:putative transposase